MATPSGASAPPPGPGSAVQYAYMFAEDKSPTTQLDALLRAIARHILEHIGDRCELQLTPKKLAAYYKAAGGDYDSLFVETPHSSISYMWQVTGCQHTLQPTDDDFEPPSIPALTTRGFSRWQSLEILLGPEEHVPFLQHAVKNWSLKHPETGELFPAELPATVFPAHTDPGVDLWHKVCSERLNEHGSGEDEKGRKVDSSPEKPEPRFAYVRPHVHANESFANASARHRADEAENIARGFSYTHVPPSSHPLPPRHTSGYSMRPGAPLAEKLRRPSPTDEQARRRSFSDYPSPSPVAEPFHPTFPPDYLDPNLKRPHNPRRHSHPRNYSTASSDEEPVTMNARPKRRQHPESPPPPSARRFAPSSGSAPSSTNTAPPSFRPHRSEIRVEEQKRRGMPSPKGSFRSKLQDTVSSLLPGGAASDRPRGSRQNSYNEQVRSRRSREQFQPTRLSRSYSDLDSEEEEEMGTSEDDVRRRRRARDERDARDRIRDKARSDRDRDQDRDSSGRKERAYLRRPEVHRRTSSHADIDRRRDQPTWDPRDPRDRESVRAERKKWDRREDRNLSPVTGVGGRRYPEAVYS